MPQPGLPQQVSGILRVSDTKSLSIMSDYGCFPVSLLMNHAALDQVNGREVVFDFCSRQNGIIQVNNIEFLVPPEIAGAPSFQGDYLQLMTDLTLQNNELSISDVPEELICTICQEVLRHPVVTKCDHLFCHNCMSQWIKSQSVCPMDRKPVTLGDLRTPPRYLTNMLDKQKVRCDYFELGCKVIVQLGNLEEHLKQCPFGKKPASQEKPSSCNIL